MAKIRIVVEAGQSNASPNVADSKSWYDQYPHLGIGSSEVQSATVPQVSSGSQGDIFTMTGRFPGGPTVDQLGSKVVGSHQTANLAGVAIENVLVPVFYSPAHFRTFDVGASHYPGIAVVSGFEAPTPTRFLVDHQAQPANQNETVTSVAGNVVTKIGHGFSDNDLCAFGVEGGALPTGISGKRVYRVKNAVADQFEIDLWPEVVDNAAGAVVNASGGSGTLYCFKTDFGTITRRSTGTTHYAASGAPGPNSLGDGRLYMNVYPQFSPPPQPGELIEYPVTLGKSPNGTYSHSTAGPMAFRTRFGGLIDRGSTVSVQNARVRQPKQNASDTVPPPARITCEKLQLHQGRPIVFSKTQQAGFSSGATKITTATTPIFRVGDPLTVAASLSPLVAGDRYWVVDVEPDGVYVATTKGGAAVSVSAGIPVLETIMPDGLAFDTIYYVTRLVRSDFPATATVLPFSFDSGGANLTFAIDHGMVEQERVKLTGDNLPPQFISSQDYYVFPVDSKTIQLSDRPEGSPISFTYTAGQTCNLERNEDLVSFHISREPGGEEIAVGDGQDAFSLSMSRREVFAGSLTGMQLRCLTGANAGESVMLTHVEYDDTGNQDLSLVHHEGSWTNTPTEADTFVIEPPPVKGQAVDFPSWCKILPLCPFEGQGQGRENATQGTMIGGPPASNEFGDTGVVASVLPAKRGDIIKFYGDGEYLPNRLVPGKAYYATGTASGLSFFSETYQKAGQSDQNYQPPTIAVTEVIGNQLSFAAPHGISQREPVTFYGDDLPDPLVQGTTYFATIVDEDTIGLTDAAGASVLLNDAGSGSIDLYFPGSSQSVWCESFPHDGRRNPYPPGFSYPGQQSLPQAYQPYNGSLRGHLSGASAGMTIALQMSAHFGEPVLLVNCAFGGTSLGHKEVAPAGVTGAYAWSDLRQRISWEPSDQNGCYARLLEVLRAVKVALDEQGDTGEVELVYFNQGEEDQAIAKLAAAYGTNREKFVARLRADIQEIGLCSYNPERIPFVQPIPRRDFGSFATTVEAAIKAGAEADPWQRWVESASTLQTRNQADPYNADTVHMTGEAMDQMGEWVFTQWREIRNQGVDRELEVCNLALAHLGETGSVTSIAPPDGSADAAWCAQYFDVARDTMLERYDWSFAAKRVALVSRENDRTDWSYSYDYPAAPVAALRALQPASPTHPDQSDNFVVEVDPATDRQVIYTNTEGAWMRYTAPVVDLNRWSAQARLALSHSLASMLAGPKMKGEIGQQQAVLAQQVAEAHASRAAAFDGQTAGQDGPEDDTPFMFRDRL